MASPKRARKSVDIGAQHAAVLDKAFKYDGIVAFAESVATVARDQLRACGLEINAHGFPIAKKEWRGKENPLRPLPPDAPPEAIEALSILEKANGVKHWMTNDGEGAKDAAAWEAARLAAAIAHADSAPLRAKGHELWKTQRKRTSKKRRTHHTDEWHALARKQLPTYEAAAKKIKAATEIAEKITKQLDAKYSSTTDPKHFHLGERAVRYYLNSLRSK